MTVSQNEFKPYLKAIKKELQCSSEIKKAFIADLSCKIYDFLETHETASMIDIIQNFGTPTEIANSFKDINLESFKIKVIKSKIFAGLLTILILGLIIFIVVLVIHIGGTATITS